MYISVSEVMEYVEENDVKFIKLAFSDIYGKQRNISITSPALRKAFDEGVRINANNIEGFCGHGNTDIILRPDPATMNILPWRPQQGRVLRFYCDLYNADGTAYDLDSRRLLKETVDLLAERKIGFSVGLRSEFYLFQTDDDGVSTSRPIDNAGYLDVAPLDRGENIRREICLTLEEMDIQTEKSFHEKGPGQNEIDFKGSDALSTADNYMTFKNVVSVISARNGVSASFKPKPIKEKSGNGLHILFALRKNGENLAHTDRETLSHFLAGIYNRMPELTAVFNSHKTSYDRFGQYEAPKFIAWSEKNLGQLICVPASDSNGRCSLRSPDAYLNPYVALAVLIKAGLEGIDNAEKLPAPIDEDDVEKMHRSAEGYASLPASLEEAVRVAREGDFLERALGKVFAEKYLAAVENRG